jgi:hypothetical protein
VMFNGQNLQGGGGGYFYLLITGGGEIPDLYLACNYTGQ